MGIQVIVPGVTTVVAVVTMTVFLWRVFGKRFDALDARLDTVDQRFVTMEAKVDERFGKVDERFEKMEAKVDERFGKMEAKFDDRLGKVDARLGAIEVSVAALGGQFEGLRDRFGTLEGKVDGLAADHQRLSGELAEFRGEMHGRLGTLAPPVAGA